MYGAVKDIVSMFYTTITTKWEFIRKTLEHTGVPGNMKRLNISLRKLMSFDPRKRTPIKENNMLQGP